nr:MULTISPECIES: ROK family protein [Actinomycetes]
MASAAGVARLVGVPSALEVALRVRAGDQVAEEAWAKCVGVLAEALAWATPVSDCRTVVVGGGLAESGALLLDPLAAAVSARLAGIRPSAIAAARHGAAAVVGATLLPRELVGSLSSCPVPQSTRSIAPPPGS